MSVKKKPSVKKGMTKRSAPRNAEEIVSAVRSKQIVLMVDVKKIVGPIPLKIEPEVKAVEPPLLEGLAEFAVKDTAYKLVGMIDPSQEPTIEQRRAIARRLIDIGPKLPQYIQGAAMPAHMFHSSAMGRTKTKEGGEGDATSSTPRAAKKATAEGIPNGVPLKKVCAQANVDPKVARRILRSKGKKPAGRWEWTPEDVPAVVELLKIEAAKLEKKP